MGGRLKISIAVLLAALACAPVAGAAESPEETELLFLELTPRKDVQVWVEVRPQVGVAVVNTLIGMSKEGVPRPRNGSVDYAARIPKVPLDGRVDVRIPGIASVEGEVIRGGEGREFNGSVHFTGNGRYLNFDAEHVSGQVLSGTADPCPEGCYDPNPALFEYIYSGITFSNSNTQILTSDVRSGHGISLFLAMHNMNGPQTTFKAQTLEWLPKRVAVVRTLAVERAAGRDLKVSSKAEHPKAATVRPPAPFSGSAVYQSAGSIRSSARGALTGSLSVDLFGVKVRLAGPRAKASLINLNPDY